MKSRCVEFFFLVAVAFSQATSQKLLHPTPGVLPSIIKISQNDVAHQSTSFAELNSKSSFTTPSKQFRPTRKSVSDLLPKKPTENPTTIEELPFSGIKEQNGELRSSPAIEGTEELQEQHSKPKDSKEDFLHFVQSAIKRSQKQKTSPSNGRRAQILIKKLINITPRLRNQSSVKITSQELSRKETLPEKNFFRKKEAGTHSLPPTDETSRRKSFLGNSFTNKLRQHPRYKEFNFGGTQGSIYGETNRFPNYAATTPPAFGPFHVRHETKDYSHISGIGDTTSSIPSIGVFENQAPSRRTVSSRLRENEDFDTIESRRQAESAKYSFSSDVRDDINGNLHQRQETREGAKVTGSYTYEDGFFRRTVHYIADEKGYRVIKEKVNEIGDGPLYNPEGSAKFHANIAGHNVDYRITTRDFMRRPQVRYQQPMQNFDRGHDWSY